MAFLYRFYFQRKINNNNIPIAITRKILLLLSKGGSRVSILVFIYLFIDSRPKTNTGIGKYHRIDNKLIII